MSASPRSPALDDADLLPVRIAALHVYPVKSCAGVALDEALLIETGLEHDRTWMAVDGAGRYLTQRTLPRMALIRPTLKSTEMVLRAPGMLALHVALDRVETPATVTIWNDTLPAWDMGDLCAQWFSDFLGQRVRLVRFDPEQKRVCDRRWTGEREAETAFSDGFPLLVTGVAALDELNRRLANAQLPAAEMARFRPNLVLDGLDAHGEDALDELVFPSEAGEVRLRLVKPCGRCPIPDVDPATGIAGHGVVATLSGYRADPRLGGAITFGMNAVLVAGFERRLRVGQGGSASFRFD